MHSFLAFIWLQLLLMLAEDPIADRGDDECRNDHRWEQHPVNSVCRLEKQIRESDIHVDSADTFSVCNRYKEVALFAPTRTPAVPDNPVGLWHIMGTIPDNNYCVVKICATCDRVVQDAWLVRLKVSRVGLDRYGNRSFQNSSLHVVSTVDFHKWEPVRLHDSLTFNVGARSFCATNTRCVRVFTQ